MSNNIQSAIMAAKKRMKSGYWVQKMTNTEQTSQDCNSMDKMYEIVSEIMKSNQIVTDPISRMMDKEHYSSLSEEQRNVYVLEIGRIYAELRARYYTESRRVG